MISKDQTSHDTRKAFNRECPTCGAEPFRPCQQATPKSEPFNFDMETADPKEMDRFEKACLEYQIFGAAGRLRQIDPDHVLVRVIEAVIREQSKG